MNKDSWTLVFNKANDVTAMGMEELRERRKITDEEIKKRNQEKYKTFLLDLRIFVSNLFQDYFSDPAIRLPHFVSRGEDEDENVLSFLFIYRGSPIEYVTIDTEENSVWFSSFGKTSSCTSEECRKIIDFLLWLEDN